MASIVKRKNKFSVVYTYEDDKGVKRQRWESFPTRDAAKKRKDQVEHEQNTGTFIAPSSQTIAELLEEYMAVYGVSKWAMSTYEGKKGLIHNYINPLIGEMKLEDVTPRVIDRYYQELLKVKAVSRNGARPHSEYVTPHTVREIHKIMRTAFKQAVKWELMARNPAENATLPKEEHEKREIWTLEVLSRAIAACDDDDLLLAINLAFSCSLRMGEMLGLTWDCVDISEDSIENGYCSIFVNKELQRVQRDTYEILEGKDVVLKFPSLVGGNNTVLVLKEPKTEMSKRKVYLPRTVAMMLVERKKEQEKLKELFGDEYADYGLVFAYHNGRPMESQNINRMFNKLIRDNDLPKVVFHSLRHSSITYKLKLNGGDMKSVQGDSGHSQLKMVADVYSHIIDEDRCMNAQRFEEAFYSTTKMPELAGKVPQDMMDKPVSEDDNSKTASIAGDLHEAEAEKGSKTNTEAETGMYDNSEADIKTQQDRATAHSTDDRELVEKLLSNPETLALLKSLAKAL